MKRMFKKSMSILLAFTLLFGTLAFGLSDVDWADFAVKAEAGELITKGYYSYVLYEYLGARLISVDKSIAGNVVVPAYFDGQPLAYIHEGAFSNCTAIKSITLPNTVSYILEEAFSGCTSLESITLSSNLVEIGYQAFENCTSLKSIVIPNGAKTIGSSAFRYCENLTSVTLSNSITSIRRSTFSGCKKLENITIPNTVTEIDSDAFYNCESLTSVTILGDITIIGSYAFSGCKNLKNITIPDTVTKIDTHAFSGCAELKSITIPAAVTSIYLDAFDGCDGLESITVEKENTVISSDELGVLFNKDKTKLFKYPAGNTSESYIIPDGVTSVQVSAFVNCNALKSIIFPDSIAEITTTVIANCANLEFVHIPESVTALSKYNLKNTDAYICSTTENCSAKEFADENGFEFRVCSGHNVNVHTHTPKTITEPATCTEGGFERVVCEECGATLSEKTIPAKGHTAGNWTVEVLATCTENGTKVKKCVDCGEIQQSEPIVATGHIPGEWVVIKPATTTTTGIKAQRCANCSEILVSEDTPVLVARVHDVSVSGTSIDYKSSITIAPVITADEGVGYTVTYSSSNPDAVVIDENGNVIAKGVGVAEITVTVTDEKGNVVTDTCEIEVRYNWWQWIIRIFLLGFLWY